VFSRNLKRCVGIAVPLLVLAALCLGFASTAMAQEGKCLTCHKALTPGIYQQWLESEHSANDVGCLDCHAAEAGDPDAFDHNGELVATLVTPKDCGVCHKQESEEFTRSHHAKAGQILDSADNYLAGIVAGHPAVVTGCESCHGAKVLIDNESTNRLDPLTWPNSGIGRINPDGTLGACSTCHMRHEFSKAQARHPSSCSKCHLGPDHPQKEVYEESKHGNTFFANVNRMNLDSDSWVVGKDYHIAPTCATCHMSATKKLPVTHDVRERISWNLRAPISKHIENGAENRKEMQEVCSSCHTTRFYEGFYDQLDGLVYLYNEKFAKPSKEIIDILKKNGSLEREAAFGNEVEWIYWEIWHHEGRRARHGAAMMGPDYAWWHGMYEVAKHFYFDYLPAVRELGDEEANAYIDDLLENDPWHQWLEGDKAATKEFLNSGEYKKLYEDMYQFTMEADSE
jgi:hypothetical protein